MSVFKVGDKVEILKGEFPHKKGTIGKVSSVYQLPYIQSVSAYIWVMADGVHKPYTAEEIQIVNTIHDPSHAQACVNACEGINPEAVPDLLRAIKIAEKSLGGQWRVLDEFRGLDRDEAIGELRGMFVAAIAKAEGGAE